MAVLAAWAPFAIWSLVAGSGRNDLAREAGSARETVWVAASWCLVAVVLAWAAAWGASARQASLPGALSCFGLALVAFVPTPSLRSHHRSRSVGLVLVHVLVVACAARWAAFAVTVGGGILRSAVVLVAGAIAVVLLDVLSDRARGPEHQRPSDRAGRPR